VDKIGGIVAALLDVSSSKIPKMQSPQLSTPDSVADLCLAVLSAASAERREMFYRYSKEDVAFVYDQSNRFLEKLVDHLYLSVPCFKDRKLRDQLYALDAKVQVLKKTVGSVNDNAKHEASERDLNEAVRVKKEFLEKHDNELQEEELLYQNNVKMLKLGRKTDYAACVRMFDCFSLFLRPDVQALIRDALKGATVCPPGKDSGIEGEIILYRDSPFGPIVIGGPGNNKYTRNCCVIIDVGGNDIYENNAGASYSSVNPFGVVIDYNGNDQYRNTSRSTGKSFCQGAGVCGVGLLVDLRGNDVYEGPLGSQGFGFLGCGALYDVQGNDCYKACEWTQGASIFGCGILIDLAGADTYEGRSYCQAFAGTKGVGMLIDGAGNDRYACGGYHKSMFDTKDAFDGQGQGCAMGLRSMAPNRPESAQGGIALLLDLAGDDSYEGAEFSQGVGYYYAMGMLVDCGGEDKYTSARFGGGVGVHSGVGVLVDEGKGNDSYSGKGANSLGAGWDVGMGVLLDQGGDDKYKCEWQGLGCGAQNGIGMLLDLGGVDAYQAKGMSMGYVGRNDYRGGKSLGVLIDANSANDRYVAEHNIMGKVDNATLKAGSLGLFLDVQQPLGK